MVKTQWTDGYTCYFQKWTLLNSNGYRRILFISGSKEQTAIFHHITNNANGTSSPMLWKNERTLQFPEPMKSDLAALTRPLNSTPQYYTSLIPTRKLSCHVPPYTGRSDWRVRAQKDRRDFVSCSRNLLQHRCSFSIGPLVVFWFALPQELVLKYYLHAFYSKMLIQRNYLQYIVKCQICLKKQQKQWWTTGPAIADMVLTLKGTFILSK